MKKILTQLRNRLIVSCQAAGESPFNSPAGVTLLAKAAKLGGAAAIRSEGIEKTKTIISEVGLPVVGLVKSHFDDGTVKITGSMKDVKELLNIGTDIIALDGTMREREGKSGPAFIEQLKKDIDITILADIATIEEAKACAEAGADAVSTTLSGYTPETIFKREEGPDFRLVEEAVAALDIPVFAEGRIHRPETAADMLKLGAWGVVVGTSITRPNIITEWYVKALSESGEKKKIR